jgi:hypothetical protein
MGREQAIEHAVRNGNGNGFLDGLARRVAISTMSLQLQRVAAPLLYLARASRRCDGRAGLRCRSAPDEHAAVPVALDALLPMVPAVGDGRLRASSPTDGSCS